MNKIKEIVEDYNKGRTPSEVEIKMSTITSACLFDNCLKMKGLTGYNIVPSPTGKIYFEWDDKNYSLGICISESYKVGVEYLVKNPHDFFGKDYDLTNMFEVKELFGFIQEATKGGYYAS